MKKQPKISIIIPVYNVGKYLRQCLTSVVNQTLKDIEIICVNDGSTDNSLSILQEYAKKDDRIVLIDSKHIGTGKCRNYAIEKSKGEYIGFVDPDDYIESEYFEKLYSQTINSKADIVFQTSRIEFYENDNKQIIFETPFSDNVFEFRHNIIDKNAHLWSKIFKNDFVKKNNLLNAETRRSQDLMFSVPAIILAKDIKCINNAKYFYRKGHHSVCQSDYTTKDIDEIIILWQRIIEKIKDTNPNFISIITCRINYIYKSILKNANNEIKRYFIDKISQQHFVDFDIKQTNINKNIVIKNPSPENIKKIWWGDYWLGLDLSLGLKQCGFNVMTDYIEDFNVTHNKNTINIVIRGLHKYKARNKHNLNILYIISHFDEIKEKEFKQYDIILCASIKATEKLRKKYKNVHYVPQFTNKERFYYEKDEIYNNQLIFIGNAYNGCRDVVKYAINKNLPISIFGNFWETYIDKKYIKGKYIDNYNLHKFYSNADIVLNDTNHSMKENGFVSNRVYDVTACKGFLISDYIKEIEDVYGDSIPMYKNEEELEQLVTYYLAHPEERKIKAQKAFEITTKNYTNQIISNQINEIIYCYKKSFKRRFQEIIYYLHKKILSKEKTSKHKIITILGIRLKLKKSMLKKIFSLTKTEYKTIIYCLGIKIVLTDKHKLMYNTLKNQYTQLDNNIQLQIKDLHRCIDRKIENKFSYLDRLIKSDNHLIFKYITKGIEIHPIVACERVVIDDYNDVLKDKLIYPPFYYQHVHRYLFALNFLEQDDSILDIACGTGYGSKLFAQNKIKSVIGADISQTAINFASRLNNYKNLSFVKADALDTSIFMKNNFSKIVSFETLEHVPEEIMHTMLENFYIWLKKGGMLIASTPNQLVNPYNPQNCYHFKHYTVDELYAVLNKIGYKDISFYYQDNDEFIKNDEKNIGRYIIFTAIKK